MMTVDEAAAALGVRWQAIRRWMVAAGWIVDVGDYQWRTSHAATAGGYLAAITVTHQEIGRQMVRSETGFRITPAGMIFLRRALCP